MQTAQLVSNLLSEARKTLVGQEEPLTLLITALLCGGHVLIEGPPGTAKTLMAKTLAQMIQADFRRIQFTPDLMPSDVVGTQVYDLSNGQFRLRKGPIFTQILLGDEINRAPAKTQSALLEAMEERQVTIEGQRLPLPEPFFVIATQNPIEYEGTYPLPEAQLDRFLFKVVIDYASREVETEVLRRYHLGFDAHQLTTSGLRAIVTPEALTVCRAEIAQVQVEQGILNYIVAIVQATRNSPELLVGASLRAGIALLLAAKTLAAIYDRNYVTPDDVKLLARPVLRHRIILRPEAEIEGLNVDTAIGRILNRVEVPR
ncbi:MoxR family ATPase [Chloroflexus sp. MS-CIW-1]|jgi:MoxR-like ATPase|uniref:AAA family ATPase n=1 Tax=Chloroflexus sp. MS-CIW-1 TaxID=3055768 RepID=UPI0026493A0F|nr:MoxR family ATPase [Chloroflexus sp. MS-CIW-1]MDN5272139.1 MoxR family ATPase [Chloroflexus sp. MS-CIW-1]